MTIITLTDSTDLTDRLDRVLRAADDIADAISAADSWNDDTKAAIEQINLREDWELYADAESEACGVEDRLYEARDAVTALCDLVHQIKNEVER